MFKPWSVLEVFDKRRTDLGGGPVLGSGVRMRGSGRESGFGVGSGHAELRSMKADRLGYRSVQAESRNENSAKGHILLGNDMRVDPGPPDGIYREKGERMSSSRSLKRGYREGQRWVSGRRDSDETTRDGRFGSRD